MADDEEFLHLDDIEVIERQIMYDVASGVSDYVAKWAKDFNRRQPRNSSMTLNMSHKPIWRPPPIVEIRKDLLRDLTCEVCACPYAVYAIALYCPDCGAPNLAMHFRREIALIHEQLTLASEQDDLGKSELAYRIMGNAHEDVVTAFETSFKTVYRHLVRRDIPDEASKLCAKKTIGNSFQSIARTREKFALLKIDDPFDILTDDELTNMTLNIEKRHVIGHNLGIADEHYAALTQSDQLGETVRLIADSVRDFADNCLTVIAGLERYLIPSS